MLVLDTDHLVELDRGSAKGTALREKLERLAKRSRRPSFPLKSSFGGGLHRFIGNVTLINKFTPIDASSNVSSFSLRGTSYRGTRTLWMCFRLSGNNVFGSVRWI